MDIQNNNNTENKTAIHSEQQSKSKQEIINDIIKILYEQFNYYRFKRYIV